MRRESHRERERERHHNLHRDAEEAEVNENPNAGRRSSWVKVERKVWRCVSVSEDPLPSGDTL